MRNLFIFLLPAFIAASSAIAQTVLIDFNDAAGSDGTTINAPTGSPTATLGSDTLTFSFANINDSGGTGHDGNFDPGIFAEAAEDYFFVRGTGQAGITGTISISGFTGTKYTLSLASSVSAQVDDPNIDRLADIQVNGVFADSGGDPAAFGDDYNADFHGFDTGTPLVWNNVTPGSGTITLTIQTPAGDPPGFATDYIGFVNGLQITQIPEPSSMLLLLTGLTLVLVRRQSR
jgi:hypothetical protein